MAADIDEKSDDSKELAESYVDLLPPKRSKLFAKLLTHRDKLRLVHYFEVLPVCWEPIIVNWWILIARCRTVSLSLYICLSVCLSISLYLSVCRASVWVQYRVQHVWYWWWSARRQEGIPRGKYTHHAINRLRWRPVLPTSVLLLSVWLAVFPG